MLLLLHFISSVFFSRRYLFGFLFHFAIYRHKELTEKMNDQNNDWQTTMVKLKTQHAATKKSLKDAESRLATIDAENKTLVEKNTSLNVSLQWAVKQYHEQVGRVKDIESTTKMDKTNLLQHCHHLIAENKKRQWCVVCHKQGGSFYCSSTCKETYWYALISKFQFTHFSTVATLEIRQKP